MNKVSHCLDQLLRPFTFVISIFGMLAIAGWFSVSQAESNPGAFYPQASASAAATARQQALQRQAEERRYQLLTSQLDTLPGEALAQLSLTDADIQAIEEENQRDNSGSQPLRTGTVKSVSITLDLFELQGAASASQGRALPLQGGTGQENPSDGLIWVGRMDVSGADSIRLRFDDLNLPPGTAAYLYNDAGDLRGPYQGQHSTLWSHSLPIAGGAVFVQLTQVPELVDEPPEIQASEPEDGYAVRHSSEPSKGFHIGAALLNQPFQQSLCSSNAFCIEDASCYQSADWSEIDNVREAIAHYSFIDGGSGYVCTGGLVNDKDPSGFIPYFLTANHCVSTAAVAATIETYFDYQTSSCGASCPSKGSSDTLGAILLDTSAHDDHTFLQLKEKPGGVSGYLGWTSESVSGTEGYQLYRISHPKGSPQAYSTSTVWVNNAPHCDSLPSGNYIYSKDQIGSTQKGSSGSPVLNADGRIVGQLLGRCGPSPKEDCNANNATVDGAFSNYYSRIKKWLADTGTPSAGPDLVITSVTSPTTGLAGEVIENSVVVKNQGDTDSGSFQIGFYLSKNSSITTWDIYTNSRCNFENGLPAGVAKTCSGPVALPDDLASGSYYFGAYADDKYAVTESNETNNGLAAGNQITISNGTDPIHPEDPFPSSFLFVAQQYLDFFGFSGSSTDIAYWTNLLDSDSLTRADVIQAFYQSPLFQTTYARVARLYFAVLNRTPDINGLQYHVARLNAGYDITRVATDFTQSPEFKSLYGNLDDGAFVDLLYLNVLDRPADPLGYQYWTTQLANGTSRGGVLIGFSDSPEYIGNTAHRSEITLIDVAMLRRAPTQTEVNSWISRASSGADLPDLIAETLGSNEYIKRF